METIPVGDTAAGTIGTEETDEIKIMPRKITAISETARYFERWPNLIRATLTRM